MEILSIELKTYEKMQYAFTSLNQKIQRLYNLQQDKGLSEWMDNQDVCSILNISPRTLQSLRNSRKITYSQIERRIYYNKKDILALLEAMNKPLI
ncbi:MULTISPECIES: helix-turn-helix domain-containing protein [unclassified Bacteroides]|uniref:helix-turn-helix domain-containing protein n=1 Tax=unclassified Bacteroides TaxID=2646097 RepID=UPI000E9B32B0|nr:MULTISPECIES: helix-turn-helix domain-containing protein [unclassified Bacteroides]RGN59190.1 DNA-binding protein [Bacteroides sp. OM05-10AA]RGQ65083.1 DNA-binding protein [Bacteroides sp. AF27-33]